MNVQLDATYQSSHAEVKGDAVGPTTNLELFIVYDGEGHKFLKN